MGANMEGNDSRWSNFFGAVFYGFLTVGLGVWLLKASVNRFGQMLDKPDANGDGVFTISDIPIHIINIILAPGEKLQIALADTRFGAFLEMSMTDPSVGWTVVLSVFAYALLVGGADMVLEGCFKLKASFS